jgi:tetratricopeptide (TPR) repeat protein
VDPGAALPLSPDGVFAVTRAAGADWDPARSRREQDAWDEHAAFMDGLVADGFVVLGGPITPTEALLVVRARDAAEIERRLGDDPWTAAEILVTASVHPWELLLGGLVPREAAAEAPEWERRLDELWASFDDHAADEFVAGMDALAATLPDEAVALFERASAFDSVGEEARAVELYERALADGLGGARRRRAAIQLASSLRNVGRADEGVALLRAERDGASDELDDAMAAFLALALADTGREREAVSVLLTALAPHLPRYRRSVENYARLLVDEGA